VDYFIIN